MKQKKTDNEFSLNAIKRKMNIGNYFAEMNRFSASHIHSHANGETEVVENSI